jgi:Rap1a immunity proteins
MMRLFALIALLGIGTSTPADVYVSAEKTAKSVPLASVRAAKVSDGNQLYQLCTGDNAAGKNFCLGYVAGVAYQNANAVCLPHDATVDQLGDTVKKYLTDHPQARRYTAYSEVLTALQKAFPCGPA